MCFNISDFIKYGKPWLEFCSNPGQVDRGISVELELFLAALFYYVVVVSFACIGRLGR